MKSLIRTAKTAPQSVQGKSQLKLAPTAKREVAQCCAKVSKTVAGCHD